MYLQSILYLCLYTYRHSNFLNLQFKCWPPPYPPPKSFWGGQKANFAQLKNNAPIHQHPPHKEWVCFCIIRPWLLNLKCKILWENPMWTKAGGFPLSKIRNKKKLDNCQISVFLLNLSDCLLNIREFLLKVCIWFYVEYKRFFVEYKLRSSY